MPSEKSELKPCPFCGCDEVEIRRKRDYGARGADYELRYFVSCEYCGASSGLCWSEEMAINHWNRRADNDRQRKAD